MSKPSNPASEMARKRWARTTRDQRVEIMTRVAGAGAGRPRKPAPCPKCGAQLDSTKAAREHCRVAREKRSEKEKKEMSTTTTDPRAAKIIDDLLVLFDLYRRDFSVICDALDYVQACRDEHPEHPVTVSLSRFLKARRNP